MEQWAIHFINWLSTAGLVGAIGYCARLSYRITKLEKDVDFINKAQLGYDNNQKANNELLLDIRDRLTRLEVVIKSKYGDYDGKDEDK